MSDNTEDVKAAITRLLKWIGGFEDSTLYESYREYEGFTDDEWGDTLSTLERWAITKAEG